MNENNPLVCVIDDESSIRESLSSLLRSAGLKVQAFSSAREFLASAPLEALSCLVLDVRLPGISGLDLQQELVSKDIQIPIIFLPGHGDVPMSVRAIKAGAIEFFTKPFDDEYLLEAIRTAIARDNKNERSPGRMAKERFEERIGTDRASRAVLNQPEIVISSRLNGNGKAAVAFGEIIGQSRAWRQIIRQIEMVAPTDATVLVLGETGTGKELIARDCTGAADAKINRWFGSTAPVSRRNRMRANSSATPGGHLPARLKTGLAASRQPPVEPCFWMSSAKSLSNCRANCCAFCRRNLTSV